MTTLTKFDTTSEWQELTGVTGTAGTFTLQNTGGVSFSIYEGATPVDADALIVSRKGIDNESSVYVEPNSNKIWVKSSLPTRISITEA